jgi:RNA polymerase sigma factor (sigma-70 family)
MQATQDERRELFTMAYYEHAPELIRHARSMVNDYETSEDLVQEAFVKAWMYLVRQGKIHTMRAFLHHILNNLIVDGYRKHKTSSLDSLLEKGYEPGADEYDRLVDILDGRRALKLIDQLPSTYQEVLRMKYERCLSYKEISRLTGQQQNTIAVQVHRGLEKLKMM